uniref:Uncharacterized protein n=1 Tax=Chrysoporthe austroafricana TaxID=354353 RepID=A0A191MX07_9PEZI|nr:hypothetical protein [Chrysoporthe austroafricana]AMX22083.1 hypothetical protein [Chrysoporthe austroafricana]
MNYLLNKLNINLDAPSAWGIYFQDSATPLLTCHLFDMLGGFIGSFYVHTIIVVIVLSCYLLSFLLSKDISIQKSTSIRVRSTLINSVGVRRMLQSNSSRGFSTKTQVNTLTNNHIDPWFITGFTDAEASFMVIMRKKLKGMLLVEM